MGGHNNVYKEDIIIQPVTLLNIFDTLNHLHLEHVYLGP